MAGTSDTPDGSPSGPDDINSRLAEIAAELASEARFKEPSAAERARARVTAIRPPGKPVRRRPFQHWPFQHGPFRRRRARRRADELRRPVAAAGAPVPAPERPARPSWRARRAASRAVADRGYADAATPSVLRSGTTVAVMLALLIGVSIGLRFAFRHGGTPAPHPATKPASKLPTIGARQPLPAFSTADPFANSPAVSYPSGPEGILAPTPVRTGPFTAAQVSDAYTTVKQLLTASNLSTAALLGGAPTAFGNLLTPQQRTALYLSVAPAPAAQPGNVLASRSWLTVFAPGTGLVGHVIKVLGLPMKAAAVADKGRTVLQITTNDLFVYPVQDRYDQASRVRVVVHVYATILFARWDHPGGPLQPWVAAMTPYDLNVQCGATGGFVHPQFADVGPGSAAPSIPPVDPYSLASPQGSCSPVTGT